MPVRAYVVAIGPYHKRLVDALWYTKDRYRAVPEGATIVTVVFESISSWTTQQLAEAFGIDVWDFARHQLDAQGAKIDLLQEVFGWERPENFMVLRDAEFEFYFIPLH